MTDNIFLATKPDSAPAVFPVAKGQRVRTRFMAAPAKGSSASNAPDAGAALTNAIGR